MANGWVHKLYWRQGRGELFHCYERHGRLWESLCGRYVRATAGGQECCRPDSRLRCAMCDIGEMKIRKWDESGPPPRKPKRKGAK